MHKLNRMLVGLILLGGILLVGATVWSRSANPRDYWTQEDAQARAEVGNEYHAIVHHEAHAKSDEQRRLIQAKMGKARARWEEAEQNLQNARDRYQRPVRLMRYSGIACLVVGILGYFIVRSTGRN